MLKKTQFKLARIQALNSNSKFRVGCCIALGSRIKSLGRNDMEKTHPMISQYNINAKVHAEVDACIGLRPYDLRGCDAYVYRVKANGMPGLARPCPMCMEVLRYMGIKRVFYTTDEPPYWKKERI